MNIISLLKFIINHPINKNNQFKAFFRFVKWQINVRLNPYPIIYDYTEKCKLIVQRGMTGATQNLYCGLHEYNDMSFLLHFLRKDDFFIDIGANIGSYTILASGHIGSKTYAFEPVPSTYARLIDNIAINRINDRVIPFNIALGSSKGAINFTSDFDTMNHVAGKDEANVIKVPVEILDTILIDKEIPLLLKIDVEGFETEVIKGGDLTLKNKGLKAIIIELNGSGNRYGKSENDIHEYLLSLNFLPYQYNPQKRVLNFIETFGSHNTIYIRDLNFIIERIQSAPKIKIHNVEF